MRKVVNIDKLADLITLMINKIDNIKKEKSELQKDVLTIAEHYKGADAKAVQSRYLKEINNLNNYIKTLDDYIDYFKTLTGNYTENLTKTIANLNSTLDSNILNKNNELTIAINSKMEDL